MATAQRVLWETITFLAFVALLIVVWMASGVRSGMKVKRAAEENQAAIASLETEHKAELEALRASFEGWADAQARQEAETAFRNFSAGIQRAAAARWGGYLDTAKSSLLSQPHVAFVHLATPGGRVLISSNSDYAAAGRLGDDGQWALDSDTIRHREGSERGVFEIAGPVTEGGRTVAYLWLGYDVESAKASSRPASLTATEE